MTSQDVATFHGGPLPFITISPDGSCVVEEYAAKILSQIKGKIAVITVAGLYRTGKSYLMNRLIGMQEGFEIGPSVNPCTKGIWIWGQPVQLGEDYYAILIDTEGLGSGNKQTTDTAIFALSVLLSSYFIYNSMGPISEDTLDQLAVVSGVVRAVGEKQGGEYISPPLLWVLRDFNLKLVNEFNQTISATDYMENSLRFQSSSSKNAIRESIKQLFQERDCLAMPRPLENEADLRQINKVPFESLRTVFKTQVENFVEKVYTSIEPKRVGKVLLNGQMFTQLVSQYCGILNSNNGAIPAGLNNTAWTSVVQTQLRSSLRDAIGVYRSVLNDDGMKRLPLNDIQLKSVHLKAKALAKEKYPTALLQSLSWGATNDSSASQPGDVNQSISASDVSNPDLFYREFRQRREQLLEHLKGENTRISLGEIERLFNELIKQIIDPVISSGSPNLVLESWRTVMVALEQQCGPKYPSVGLSQFITKTVIPSIISITGSHIGGSEMSGQERKKLTERVILLESLVEEDKRVIEELHQRAGREISTGKEVEKGLRDLIRQMQEKASRSPSPELQSGAATPANLAGEIRSVKELLLTALTEIKSAESDKRAVEMKSENEKNLIELERRFNKQLNEARRRNELMIDDLKRNYEDEISRLKNEKVSLQDVARQYERDSAIKSVEIEKLTAIIDAAENDRNLKANFSNVINQQSELILQFLRNGAQLAPGQYRDLENAVGQSRKVYPGA
jgi:hypothetical protein